MLEKRKGVTPKVKKLREELNEEVYEELTDEEEVNLAVLKTDRIKRRDISIHDLVPNEFNPNVMTDRTFNMLCDNINKVGFIDPIFVVPSKEVKGKYTIIGGEHRWEVGKILGFDKVPCTIVDDPEFDKDLQTFQVVRQNIIHGKMSAEKFMQSVDSLSKKYEDDMLSELFGFTNEEEFAKLLKKTKRELPKELQDEFELSKGEIKTIDDLSRVLNRLFNEYGDTIPYGYMLIDFGGKDSVWLRMPIKSYSNFKIVAKKCEKKKVALDTLFQELLQLIATNKDIDINDILANADKVKLTSKLDEDELLTLDYLED